MSDDIFLVFETTGGIRVWDTEVQLYQYTKSAKITSVNQMEESYIGIRLRCFYCQIVSFVNHLGHSYCSHCLYNTSIFYSLVIGPMFRLYVSFLSLKICHYCLLMFFIVYDVSFNVLKHYTSLIEV